ncbi:hypothetical protein H6F75_22395 [Nodosilinea sp. FACHB-131]|uniref:hypothetical protein n=1 Tax=Cyanophyceae TaxID=3028117 RepID=UPI0016845DF0|nr:hypothetical protein [Nodosilinea sp. FACHB-131]MBD1876240.1 hypothetical protein [Nodosilinea sp. FACHB-131]
MPNPTTDYQLAYSQADVERLTRYILRLNPGISCNDAYIKAVRTLDRAGHVRKRLR